MLLPTPATTPRRSTRHLTSRKRVIVSSDEEDHSSGYASITPSPNLTRRRTRRPKRKRINASSPSRIQTPRPSSRQNSMDQDRQPIVLNRDLYARMDIPNRDPILGQVYQCLINHPLLNYDLDVPVGTVYIIVLDFSRPAMKRLHDWCSQVVIPSTDQDREALGFLLPSPSNNDFVFWRDMYGSGDAQEDILKGYAVSKNDYAHDYQTDLRELSSDIIGQAGEHSEGKGGIRLERLGFRSLKDAKRSYPIGVSNQAIPGIEGPATNSKRYGVDFDDGRKLQKRMLKAGATAGLEGLRKIKTGMEAELRAQAELSNCPRLGRHENVFWTSGQINVASLKYRDVEEQRRNKGKHRTSTGISDLGPFGRPHTDNGDNEAGITASMNLTPTHPDVEMEYFTIVDHGCCWRMDELCSIFFSGIHYHGGSEAKAKDSFDGKKPYTRVTLIMYPSGHELDGDSRVALAAVDVDSRNGLMTLNPIMRNARHQPYDPLATCESGNYIADGRVFMDDKSYLQHNVNDLLSLVCGILKQADPRCLFRVDRAKFCDAFSMVIDGVRVASEDWKTGPGWEGDDVRIGKEYEDLDRLSEDDITNLWNTDSRSGIPYDNTRIPNQRLRWKEYKGRQRMYYPLCIAANESEVEDAPRSYSYRRHARAAASRRGKLGADNEFVKQKRSRTLRSKVNTDEQIDQSKVNTDEQIDTAHNVLATSLTPEALELELELVEHESERASAESVDSLPQVHDLYSFARLCNSLDQHEAIQSFQLRAIRQDRLLINMHIWESLANFRLGAINALTAGSTPDWFGRLAKSISSWLTIQSNTLRLLAHEYLPHSFPAESSISFDLTPTHIRLSTDLSSTAIDLAEKAVLTWLNIDSREVSQRSALFTRLLVNEFGYEVLAVDGIWRSSLHLSRNVMGRISTVLPTPLELVKQVRLVSESVDDPQWIHNLLTALHSCCNQSRSMTSQKLFRMMVSVIGSSHLSPLLPRSDSPRPSSPTLNTLADDLPNEDAALNIDTFLDQLSRCLKLRFNGNVCRLPPPSSCHPKELAYLSRIMDSADRCIPFRDEAPSRHLLLHTSGPFSATHLRSRAGFFSVLVARGITHSTEFMRTPEYPALFTSYDHFQSVVANVCARTHWSVDGIEFCDPAAYGRNSGNSVSISNAKLYWDNSASDACVSWLLQGVPITFRKLIMLLSGKEFKGIGKLRALQIAIDYARAGVISVSESDFLDGLRYVNRGAIQGLRNLGYLETQWKMANVNGRSTLVKDQTMIPLDILKAAFSQFKDDILDRWNWNDYPLDLFDLEHFLCKTSMKRLNHASYYSIDI